MHLNNSTASNRMHNTNVSPLIALVVALSTGLAKASVADESQPPQLLPCSRAAVSQAWDLESPEQAWSSPPPAAKRLADLDVGPPRTVRLIYFLPNDRRYRAKVVNEMKKTARQVQTFYAEQMQAHGYGDRAFRLETTAAGGLKVHRVNGQHPDSYYRDHTTITVEKELRQTFDLHRNIYIIAIDNSMIGITAGLWGASTFAVGAREGKTSGLVFFSEVFGFGTMAHELGHALGLQHDFRDDAYIMSYGYGDDRLSACAAGFLAVHPYFNDAVSTGGRWTQRPTIDLISPWYPAGSNSAAVQLSVRDPEGLHQVILFDSTRKPHLAAGFLEVKACRGLGGEQEAVVAFDYDGVIPSAPLRTSLSRSIVHFIKVEAVDKDGDVGYEGFTLAEMSPYHIATLAGEHRGRGYGVSSVAFAPDGKTLAAGGGRTVELWDVDTKTKTATFKVADDVRSVAFVPDGKTLATGAHDGSVELWDVTTETKIATFGKVEWPIDSVSFAPDGETLATGTRNGAVELWDVATETKIATFEAAGYVSSVAFAPDGKTLATGAGKTVELWDVTTKTKIATFGKVKWPIFSVSFAPDGETLAVGRNPMIQLWDVATETKIATFEAAGAVHWVAFAPDGKTLAAGVDRTVELWDVDRKKTIATFATPGGIRSVSFAPDGKTLAAGVSDNTAQLWDVSEWTETDQRSMTQTLAKVSGEGQEELAGTQLDEPLVVSVLDEEGSPLAGVSVSFAVTAGEGLLSAITETNPCTIASSTSATTATTDANGHAATRLTLGSQPGTNAVEATVEGLEPVTFTATATEQATPHRLEKICGEDQEDTAGTQLARPLVVAVLDEGGAAMAGVVVSFAVTAGGGTLSAATATTEANGRAKTRLRLGREVGTNTVEATVEGLEPVTFTATGQESPLASLLDAFQSGKRVALPDSPQLAQNAPNPFNSQTILSYFLPAPGSAYLAVFTLTGQRVAVLHQGPQQAGYHRLHWNGRDDAGRPVASGMYLYRLITDEGVLTRKLILLR